MGATKSASFDGLGVRLALCLLLSVAALTAAARTWTDVNGRTTEAEFVDYANGLVHLRLPDGRRMSVPWDRLSAADQRYVNVVTAARKHRSGFGLKLAVGVACGLPSLLASKPKKKVGLGFLIFLACSAGGFFLGWALAVPLGLVGLITMSLMPE